MKRISILLIFCLLTCIHNILNAQPLEGRARIDSMIKAVETLPDDTVKLELMYLISNAYTRIDPEQGLEYGHMLLDLAKQLEKVRTVAFAHVAIGDNHRARSETGHAYEHYMQALNMFEEHDDMNGQTEVINGIVEVYLAQGMIDKAETYSIRRLELSKAIGDKSKVGGSLIAMGLLMYHKKNYDSMLHYFFESLEIHRELEDKYNIGILLNNISATYALLKDYTKGLEYAMQALEISESVEDRFNISACLSNIAEFQFTLARYKMAIATLDRAVKLNEETGNIENLYENYELLAKIYNKTGNYKAASAVLKKQLAYKDSLYVRSNKEQIERLELTAKHEREQLSDSLENVEKQKLAAAKLKKQKTFTYSGICVAIILSVLAFFIAKERKKSDELLLNILPSEVAAELKKKGESDAKLFDNVTVLFTDFVGFTKVSEMLSPQELVQELDTCFKAFDGIIGKYGMEKIKTIGDAYLAVCGLPAPDEQHAEKVVKAGQEIRDFMLNRHKQLGDKTFEIRIGVHSGSVVAGIVGVKKFAYDIWGDTVNTAARMEQNSEAGKINISQTTYELVQDKITCTYRGELEAKNKGKLKMYFVEG